MKFSLGVFLAASAQHWNNKDGRYFYHHCADLEIAADPAKPIDTQWLPKH
jgi:hypothetical protein